MFVNVILFGIVLPATGSAVVLGLGWRPWRAGSAAGRTGLASGALALSGGLVLAQVLLLGLPRFPPAQANDWFVLLLIAASLVGLADALFRPANALRWTLRAALSFAVPLTILWPLVRHTWSTGEALIGVTALGVGVGVLWTGLDRLTRSLSGAIVPLTLALIAGGSGAVLALSGTASLGQLAGALAATLGPALLLAWWRPAFSLARGAVPPLAVGLGGLWLNGAFYADLPLPSLALLLLAPALALAGGLRPLARLPAWQSAVVRTAAVGLLLGVAAGLAWSASPPLTPDEVYW